MPANQARHAPRENFARVLGNFARALDGAPRGTDDPCEGLDPEVLAEAIHAARKAQNAFDARILGYRLIVARFLSRSQAETARSGGMASRPAQRSGAAVAARPLVSAPADTTLSALRGLAPVERAALVLAAVERLPYEHAAGVMDLTPQEFAEALARAREAFAARLASTRALEGGRPSHLKLVG